MATAKEISVEVVLALADRQALCSVSVPAGANAAAAVDLAGIRTQFPEFAWSDCEFAVWGRPVAADQLLQDGDRVEVLRPLELDPRDARRELARDGQFMGTLKQDDN